MPYENELALSDPRDVNNIPALVEALKSGGPSAGNVDALMNLLGPSSANAADAAPAALLSGYPEQPPKREDFYREIMQLQKMLDAEVSNPNRPGMGSNAKRIQEQIKTLSPIADQRYNQATLDFNKRLSDWEAQQKAAKAAEAAQPFAVRHPYIAEGIAATGLAAAFGLPQLQKARNVTMANKTYSAAEAKAREIQNRMGSISEKTGKRIPLADAERAGYVKALQTELGNIGKAERKMNPSIMDQVISGGASGLGGAGMTTMFGTAPVETDLQYLQPTNSQAQQIMQNIQNWDQATRMGVFGTAGFGAGLAGAKVPSFKSPNVAPTSTLNQVLRSLKR